MATLRTVQDTPGYNGRAMVGVGRPMHVHRTAKSPSIAVGAAPYSSIKAKVHTDPPAGTLASVFTSSSEKPGSAAE